MYLAIIAVLIIAAVEGLLIGTVIFWLGEWWKGNA